MNSGHVPVGEVPLDVLAARAATIIAPLRAAASAPSAITSTPSPAIASTPRIGSSSNFAGSRRAAAIVSNAALARHRSRRARPRRLGLWREFAGASMQWSRRLRRTPSIRESRPVWIFRARARGRPDPSRNERAITQRSRSISSLAPVDGWTFSRRSPSLRIRPITAVRDRWLRSAERCGALPSATARTTE